MSPTERGTLERAGDAVRAVREALGATVDARAALLVEVALAMPLDAIGIDDAITRMLDDTEEVAVNDEPAKQRAALLAVARTALSAVLTLDAEARR